MDTFTSQLIATLGGDTEVARLLEAPVTTVNSWKKKGLSRSRLNHIKRAAADEGVSIDWETGERLDHDPVRTAPHPCAETGNRREISAMQQESAV